MKQLRRWAKRHPESATPLIVGVLIVIAAVALFAALSGHTQ